MYAGIRSQGGLVFLLVFTDVLQFRDFPPSSFPALEELMEEA